MAKEDICIYKDDLFDGTTTHDQKPTVTKFKGRDTGSGKLFEDTIDYVLRRHGDYRIERQKVIGKRDDVCHKIDFLVTRGNRRLLIEAKWQSRSGAGEKVVGYELMTLPEAIKRGEYDAAYIVLGGPGWTPARKESWIRGSYKNHVNGGYMVSVLDLDTFCQKVYEGSL